MQLDMLDVVGQYAASHGARRIFLEVPNGATSDELIRRAGYERYTETTVYRLSAPLDPAS